MVTAIAAPSVAAATPVKRSESVTGPSSRAAKKQRSYDSSAIVTMKRTFPEDDKGGAGHYAPSLASPSQIVKLEQPEDAFSFTTPPLKSSFKTSAASVSSPSILDSPRQGGRKGMYSDFVHAALDDRVIGKDGSYQELVNQFRPPSPRSLSAAPSLSLLQMLLHSLCNVASRLDRKHHAMLVENILSLPWATMGGDVFARIWMRFVCTLCSARSEWVSEVLSKAVKGLSYRSDWRSLAYSPPSTSSPRPTRRLIYSRIHTLLRSLLSLIPTLPTLLAPLVLRHFPHKRDSVNEHVVYIRNIFEMCEYAQELRPGVLDCIIGRCVEIDVEVQIELDDLEQAEAALESAALIIETEEIEGQEEGVRLDPFDKPIDEDSDSDAGGASGDEDNDGDWDEGLDDIQSDDDLEGDNLNSQQTSQQRFTQIRALVDKLDAIMETLFKQLEATDTRLLRICKGLQGVDSDMSHARAISLRNEHFTDLMNIFSRILLPTFKSRHVQFIVFWFSSLDRDFGDLFLGLLLSKAIYGSSTDSEEVGPASGDEVPMILRVASASYVASLVARAKYINKRDARTVMINLCAFMEAHLDAFASGWFHSQDTSLRRSDKIDSIGPHSLFYAVCQACFYIFCFRWRDLQVGTTEEDEAEGEDASETEERHTGELDNLPTSKWCEGMDIIKRAIMSSLNPLAHCSVTVAEEFAGVAQVTGFFYCWSLIESNNRNNAPVKTSATSSPAKGSTSRSGNTEGTAPSSSSQRYAHATLVEGPGGAKHGANDLSSSTTINELDSFFPFDPFRLRASAKWIDPLYREWHDVAPEGMLDDDDEEDEEEEEEDQEDDAESIDSNTTNDNNRNRGHHSKKNALKIPRPSRRSNREGFAAASASSVSTNDDEVTQSLNSLEAMSISPYGRRR